MALKCKIGLHNYRLTGFAETKETHDDPDAGLIRKCYDCGKTQIYGGRDTRRGAHWETFTLYDLRHNLVGVIEIGKARKALHFKFNQSNK